jgi:hypothetical protein
MGETRHPVGFHGGELNARKSECQILSKHCEAMKSALFLPMEKKPDSTGEVASKESEAEAKKKLSRPPKDKREVTIGPTGGKGPDVTIS